MKQVLLHWVEMRTLEIPDNFPTEDMEELFEYMDTVGDDSMEKYTVKSDTRDWEIVDVEEI